MFLPVNLDQYINSRVGHLVITKLDHRTEDEIYWRAHCDCGRDIIITHRNYLSYRRADRQWVATCKQCQPVFNRPLDFRRDLPDGSGDSRYMVWDHLRGEHLQGRIQLDPDWYDCNNFVIWAELFFNWTDPHESYTVFRYDLTQDFSPENCFLRKSPKNKVGTCAGNRAKKVYTVGDESYTAHEWARLNHLPVSLIYTLIRSHPYLPFVRILSMAKKRKAQQLKEAKQQKQEELKLAREQAKVEIKRYREEAKREKYKLMEQCEEQWAEGHPSPVPLPSLSKRGSKKKKVWLSSTSTSSSSLKRQFKKKVESSRHKPTFNVIISS